MRVRLPKAGDHVNVIEKRNYASGQLTTGIVKRTLSNPGQPHPRGNKVELEDGTVGRLVSFVDEVGEQSQVEPQERERYRQEIRGRQNGVRRVQPAGDRFRSRPSEPRTREVAVRPGDFLGRDDLR